MSEDITNESEFVGVTLSYQVLAKIDERGAKTGEKRQDVIRTALINELFQGC